MKLLYRDPSKSQEVKAMFSETPRESLWRLSGALRNQPTVTMKKRITTRTHTKMEDNLCKYTFGAVAQWIVQFTLKKVRSFLKPSHNKKKMQ